MSSDRTEARSISGHAAAVRRQRFGLLLTGVLVVAATGVSYLGTRDTWATAPAGRLSVDLPAPTTATADPAWDVELPPGSHRPEFQTSCVICHSPRLALNQPPFRREKWAEIVHKMVTAYGAPLNPSDEAQVVDYLVAVRPAGP